MARAPREQEVDVEEPTERKRDTVMVGGMDDLIGNDDEPVKIDLNEKAEKPRKVVADV